MNREFAAIVDQAVVSATNFLTSALIARFEGLELFGVFALAWIAVLFANSLQLALVISPMMSLGQKQERKQRPFYYGAVALQALVFGTLCAILVLVCVRLSGALIPRWGISGIALPLACVTFANLLQDFVRRYFFSTHRARLALYNDILSYLTQLPLLWVLHLRHRLDVGNTLWSIFATSLIGIVVGLFWIRELHFSVASVKVALRNNWKFSRWLIPAAMMQWTSGNLFVVCAPIYYGAAAAGILRGAQNIVGVAHIWFLGLDNVVPAEAARQMHEGGVSAMLGYIRNVVLRWGSLTALFAGCVALAPEFWLRLVYGGALRGHGDILQLYALLYVMVFVNGPLRSGLQALEFTKPVFWSYLAMTLFAVLFAAPFSRWLGVKGAILGIIGTQFIFQSILVVSFMVRAKKVGREMALSLKHDAVAN